jgi:hypothetical protein
MKGADRRQEKSRRKVEGSRKEVRGPPQKKTICLTFVKCT